MLYDYQPLESRTLKVFMTSLKNLNSLPQLSYKTPLRLFLCHHQYTLAIVAVLLVYQQTQPFIPQSLSLSPRGPPPISFFLKCTSHSPLEWQSLIFHVLDSKLACDCSDQHNTAEVTLDQIQVQSLPSCSVSSFLLTLEKSSLHLRGPIS